MKAQIKLKDNKMWVSSDIGEYDTVCIDKYTEQEIKIDIHKYENRYYVKLTPGFEASDGNIHDSFWLDAIQFKNKEDEIAIQKLITIHNII